MIDRWAFISAVTLGVLTAPLGAEAQAGKMWRIGHLMLLQREALTPFIEELEKGLRDLGYVEGRSITIEERQD